MRIHPVVLVAAAMVWGGDVLAGTASTTFAVNGSVIANCTISATGISFTYDPVVANATTNATATGTITLACTKGSAPSIALDSGLYAGLASAGPRAMRLGATTNYLGYDIYQPGTTNTSWTTAAPYIPSAPTSKAARNFTMNGAAIGGQDVTVGSYTDTVTATVNF